MYTGIVQKVCKVTDVVAKEGISRLIVFLDDDMLDGLKIGASVAIDGVCLSVVNIDKNNISFDVIQETLDKTTLGTLCKDSLINTERSAKQGDEIGGHILSGHIEGTAKIINIIKSENNHILEFTCKKEWMDYILPKGFIAINGASLTIVDTHDDGKFSVHLIPETLRATTFEQKVIGDMVNIELDFQTKAIVHTVKRYLKNKT